MITKKDLFRLIIKIFGLYLIIVTFFSTLPSTFLWAFSEFNIYLIIYAIIVLFVTLYLFVSLVFHPDKVIRWLKLDQGFDNNEIKIERFNSEKIIMLAILIIGGNLFIKNIPIFLNHTFFAFKSSVPSNFANDIAFQYGGQTNYLDWGISMVNLIIGYLLITNHTYISKLLKNKNANNTP